MKEAPREDLGILLAMVHAAWADKNLTESEVALIKEEMDQHGLDKEEVAVVSNALVSRPDVATIAGYLTTPEARHAAIASAYATAFADESLALSEVDCIEELASALGVPSEQREEIRTFVESRVRLARDGNWKDALLLEKFELA